MSTRVVIFERTGSPDALQKVCQSAIGGDFPQSIAGCSPDGALAVLHWTDTPTRSLAGGTDPELGRFVVLERCPREKSELFRFFHDVLSDEHHEECSSVLEFLNFQEALPEPEAARLLPQIQKLLFSGDQQTRYQTRKVRDHFLKLHPALERNLEPEYALSTEESPDKLDTREILLRKLTLGSRFMFFDAVERLCDSGDTSLADQFFQILEQEKDLFKLAYLVKRLPRLNDKRVATVLKPYLSHPDSRIVANVLEGFWYCKTPELIDEFTHLSSSEDNRVRANAIKALFTYDAPRATEHLRLMLQDPRVAMQDSAVSLLKDLPWKDIQELTDMAFDSKYMTVRLKALELLENRGVKTTQVEYLPAIDATRRHEHQSLAITLALGFIALLAAYQRFNPLVGWLALGGILSIIFSGWRPQWGSFPKIVLSWVFLAALFAGAPPLPIILGFLAVWIGEFGMGFMGREAGPRLVVWAFATFSLLFLSYFGRDMYPTLDALVSLSRSMVPTKEPLTSFLAQYQRFSLLFYVIFSMAIVVTLNLEAVLPNMHLPEKKRKYLTLSVVATCLMVAAMHLAFLFNVKLLLAGSGLSKGVIGLWKFLGE